MELKSQKNFAKMVNRPQSRISLLISMGRLEVKKIDGVIFVINSLTNRKACTERFKKIKEDK